MESKSIATYKLGFIVFRIAPSAKASGSDDCF